MSTAKFIGTPPGSWTGDARLYEVDPPVRAPGIAGEPRTFSRVIVSATTTYSGPETYIFPAFDDGKIADWLELAGSFRGALDHEAALRQAGYEVAP